MPDLPSLHSTPRKIAHNAATRARSAAKNFSSKRNAHTHTHAPSSSECEKNSHICRWLAAVTVPVRTPKSIDKNTQNSQISFMCQGCFASHALLSVPHRPLPPHRTKLSHRLLTALASRGHTDGALILMVDRGAPAERSGVANEAIKKRMQKLANRNLPPRRRIRRRDDDDDGRMDKRTNEQTASAAACLFKRPPSARRVFELCAANANTDKRRFTTTTAAEAACFHQQTVISVGRPFAEFVSMT